MLSNFQYPLAPKLTNLLSFGSKETRQTFSRVSSRGSRGTGRGSEESSCSSQSSLDEEEEEEKKNSPLETGEMFGTIQREPCVALLPLASSQQPMNPGISEHFHSNKLMPVKSKVTHFEMTLDMQQKSEALDVFRENRTADVPKKNKSVESIGSLSNVSDEPKDMVTVGSPAPGDGQFSSFVGSEQQHGPPVNIALPPAPAETCKDSKKSRAQEIKCRSLDTNQTINIVDELNMTQDHGKPKRNRRNQSSKVINTEMGLLGNIISEETSNKSDRPKMAPIKNGPKLKDAPLTRKKTPESVHQGRPSGSKKISNNPQGQKQLLTWDTKKTARPAQRPGVLGTHRTKSSLDFVSYRDMFVELHQADEGPAIFQMFATPVYENLRAGSSTDRPKQVQSAPQYKKQPSGRYTARKSVEGSRRKQKCTPSRGKQRKRKELQPPEPRRHDKVIVSNKKNAVGTGTEESDAVDVRKHLLTSEDDERQGLDVRLQTDCSRVLSVIGEVPSDTEVRINFHNQQGDSSSSFQTYRTPYLSVPFSQQKTGEHNSNKGVVISNEVEDSIAHQIPSQPLINTWTTDRTISPVCQRFLDEAGEGPVTDDLLKRLAEELISLEEREVETLKPEYTEVANVASLKFKEILCEVWQKQQPQQQQKPNKSE